jgi:hypothetical protein
MSRETDKLRKHLIEVHDFDGDSVPEDQLYYVHALVQKNDNCRGVK